MDAIETLVRDTLVEHAVDAPPDDRLLACVTDAPRRRPWLAGGLAAAMVLAIAVGALFLSNARHDAGQATTTVPAGYRSISYHGILLNVPTRLGPVIPPLCSFVPDKVIDQTRGYPDCPYSAPEDPVAPLGTVVLLGDSATRDPVVPIEPTTVGGMSARRGYGTGLIAGRAAPVGIVLLDARDVVVEVTAPTRKRIDAVLESIRPAAPNRLGCSQRFSSIGGTRSTLVPAHPVSAIVCAYHRSSDAATRWLIGSVRANDHQAAQILTAARDWIAQDGIAFAGGPICRITFTYRDGGTRTLITPAPEVTRILGIR